MDIFWNHTMLADLVHDKMQGEGGTLRWISIPFIQGRGECTVTWCFHATETN